MIVDSNLLFQRILATCSQSPEDLEEAFSFELAHHSLALFDDDGFLRDPSKHELGNLIYSQNVLMDVAPDMSLSKFVIDGGFLLHAVGWRK